MQQEGVPVPDGAEGFVGPLESAGNTVVHVALNGRLAGEKGVFPSLARRVLRGRLARKASALLVELPCRLAGEPQAA
jgi:hypothetical protein